MFDRDELDEKYQALGYADAYDAALQFTYEKFPGGGDHEGIARKVVRMMAETGNGPARCLLDITGC